MRISDWSSDVCSSDLQTWDGGIGVFSYNSSGTSESGSPQHAIDNNGRDNFLLIEFDSPDYLLTAFKIGRSEEHTSELQSLMRISYAVFCLKKKKINIRKRHCCKITRSKT